MSEVGKKYVVGDASPKALALCNAAAVKYGMRDNDETNAKYPFKSLLVGESFTVPFSETNIGTLGSIRTTASRNSKVLRRTFKVILHDDYQCIEVARIA